MSVVASELVAKVTIQGASAAKSDLQEMGSSTDSLGDKFKNVMGGVLGIAALGAGAAISGLSAVLVSSVKAAMADQAVMAQTAQAIKSTGDASGESVGNINALAESLSGVTDFSKDTIQSGENMLLTFTNIGKKVFPDATQAMLDMSQATGEDMKSASVQLGKALNDPIAGVSALARVGVTFTQSQKDSIKAMVDAGDTAGAQEVILKELGHEFGGSAEAAGKTFGGQLKILQNELENTKVKIGNALLPVMESFTSTITSKVMPQLDRFAGWFAKDASPAISGFYSKVKTDIGGVVDFIEKVFKSVNLTDFKAALHTVAFEAHYLAEGFQSLAQKAKPAGDALEPVAQIIGSIMKAGIGTLTNILWNLSGAFIAITRGAQQTTGPMQTARGIFQSLIGMSPLVTFFQVLSSHTKELGQWFQTSLVPALKQAQPGFKNLEQAVTGLAPLLTTIANTVHGVLVTAFNALIPVFEKVAPIVVLVAGILANMLGTAIKFLTPYIIQATVVLGEFAQQIITRVVPIVLQMATNISNGINTVLKIWHAVWPFLAPILQGVWTQIQGIIKIAFALVQGIILVALDLISGNWKQAWADIKNTLMGVWNGIHDVAKGAIQSLQGIIGDGIKAIANLAPGWGKDIIMGIANGIKDSISNISDAASGIANTIKSILHFSKPDVGPLVDYDTWMPDFMQGLADGMNQNLGKVKAASLNVASSISIAPTTTSSFASSGRASGLNIVPQSVAGASGQNIIINMPDITLDGQRLAKAQLPHIVRAVRNGIGVKY